MRLALIIALALATPTFAQVKVEETGKSPEPPPSPADLAYESRLKAAQASAQAFQGPLDGAWTLADGKGAELYVLQLVDKGRADPVEGAWREAAGDEAARNRGLIDEVKTEGDTLNLRFAERSVTLKLSGAVWRGELTSAAGPQPVTLVRRKP
jgi:hypothetical protein